MKMQSSQTQIRHILSFPICMHACTYVPDAHGQKARLGRDGAAQGLLLLQQSVRLPPLLARVPYSVIVE